MNLVELFSKKTFNIELNAFLSKMQKLIFYDESIEEFNTKIESFLKKYKIDCCDDYIQYSYLHFIHLYRYQKCSEEGRSDYTLKEFLHVCLRIIELYIFIKHENLYEFQKIFFSIDKYDDCIYKHFKKISNKISNDQISVDFLGNNQNKQVFLHDSYYKSNSMTIIFAKKSMQDTHFKQMFKQENNQVEAVFNSELIENTKGSKNQPGNFGKREIISSHIFNNEDELSNKIIDKNASPEDILAFQNSRVQLVAESLEKDNNFTSKRLEKYTINSSYKQRLINKAISTQLTKNSMYLKSTYNFPSINQLKLFVYKVKTNESVESSLILASLYTSFSIKELIYSFFGIHSNMEYQTRKKVFKIDIPSDIYATKRKQIVFIKLNEEITKHINIVSEYYKIKKLNFNDDKEIDYFIESQIIKVKRYFYNLQDNMNKSITFSFNNLQKCLRFYYNQFNTKRDISALLHIHASKHDKANMCYVQEQKRLINFESWMCNFYDIVNNTNTYMALVEKEDNIGSSFFIRYDVFKKFIDNLDNLYLSHKDDNIKLNLQMIFIRYSLSILLCTRNFKNSCELMNYSKRLKILTVQEKAKNIKTSKRVIPLCSFAIKIVDFFYTLKSNQENFYSYSPMLVIDNKLVDITPTNVFSFLKTVCTKNEEDKILPFIKNFKLNAGRHIFSSISKFNQLNKDYENDFLGHFYQGNLGQGIYSNFDNKDYHRTIIEFIEQNILQDYFPSKIFMLDRL